MIYIQLTLSEFVKKFDKDKKADGHYPFSKDAFKQLYNFYNSLSEDYEFNDVEIICDWEEFDTDEFFEENNISMDDLKFKYIVIETKKTLLIKDY